MNRRLEFLGIVVALAVLMLVLGQADGSEPPQRFVTKLRHALSRGAMVELEEIGTQATARDLSSALGSGEREVVLAGIAAARFNADAWVLLGPLADLAASVDRPVAATAAAVAADIAARLDRELLLEREVPEEDIEARSSAWHKIARAGHRWADVRVHALEVSARLDALLPHAERDLMDMTSDPDPEVRRAAFELLPRDVPPQVLGRAASVVIDDAEPVVALAAAQAMCRELGSGQPAEPVLAALGDAGLERLRHLVATNRAPLAALLDSARCLIADANPKSLQAVRALRDAGPVAIRPQVRRLLSPNR